MEELLKFPCNFPVKITARNTAEAQAKILELINKFIPEKDRIDYSENFSKNKNYIAVTITAIFYQKEDLDNFYRALSAESEILMVL